ncbi:MAG: hypothetical protein ACOX4U_08420 [Anaerovoracaceae bacterium]|jgi:hypothetical protein
MQLLKKALMIIWKIVLFCFAIPVAVVILPFYGIYTLFSKTQGKAVDKIRHKKNKTNKGKDNCKDNRDWIDRLEEYDALLHD